MENYAIQLENVSKTFDLSRGESIPDKLKNRKIKEEDLKKINALTKITFSVSPGEIMAIIGKNGSGKTTLLRIISEIYKPDYGTVKINGQIGSLLHIGTGFHPELTAKENITMYGRLLGLSQTQIEKKIDDIVEFAELKFYFGMKLKHYSSGMRIRLAFATALQIDPDILLMDEALAVGDNAFKEKSFKAFQKFKKMGKTVIFSTHSLGKLVDFCDRVLLIDHGKIVMIGNPKDVITKYNQITEKK